MCHARQEATMQTTLMPLRVSLATDVETLAHAGVNVPTLRRTTVKFAAADSDGVITEYTMEAVGPTQIEQRSGELTEDDGQMLRQTRRLINQLLDE
jgi:hypothetical protein